MTLETFPQQFQILKDSLIGPSNQLLYALIFVIIIDYITGVCVAIHNKKLSSKIGAKGIARKISIFALIALSHILDFYILESADALKTLTIIFYLSNECMSVLENVGTLGLPLPKKLKDILAHFDQYTKN